MSDTKVKSILFDLEKLRYDLMKRRLIERAISMDQAAQEIGISKPTISRIEHNNFPDIETFAKVIKWLGIPANEYFNHHKTQSNEPENT